jgi:hypothetical protein
MKKSNFIFVFVITIIVTSLCPKTIAQTSSEIFNKAIAFHDPLQKWADYSGKVHLTTVFSNGSNSGGEIIELQTKENYYRCNNVASRTIRGIKNNECFLEIEGKMNSATDQCDNIRQMKSWHYFHFGILMELKASGLILEDKVETVKFQGNDCLTLKFTYDAGKIKNAFYNGSNWTVYIDPVSYSMKGFKCVGSQNLFAVFSGILTVNELKIPLCRTYFMNEDNSFYMVDVFSNINDK